MGLYARHVLPRLIAWAMRHPDLAVCRCRLVPLARGRVLEVGIGSGPNLPLYAGRPAVERVIGLDPSPALLARAAAAAATAACPVHLVQASADAIPLPDRSVDTLVMTWTLCSVPDARSALAELRRVLRPGGELLFVEHGLAPEPGVAAWQRRLDPLWTRLSCHLDLPVERLLRDAGFAPAALRTGYLGTGPRPLTFLYEGRARRVA